MPILTVDSAGKRFGERTVLTAASIRVEPGQIRAIIGRNGAGKSTLLRMAAGLLAPDYGLVEWQGRRMPRARLDRLARDGVLFLPADGLLVQTRRLGDQLQLFAETFGRGVVDDVLSAMRLDALRERFVHELSGGERRRGDVAVALVREPTCLLADEPFRDIAPLDCDLVGRTLRQLAARGCAIMITGHEVSYLMEYADHITWCTSGTTLELGPPAQARKNDAFRAEYLGESWRA